MSTAVTTFSGIALVIGIVIGQLDAHLNYRRKRTARIDACAYDITLMLAGGKIQEEAGKALQRDIKAVLQVHF